MLLEYDKYCVESKCTECRFKQSRFVKEQEAKGLLSNLGIKTPYKNECNCEQTFTGG